MAQYEVLKDGRGVLLFSDESGPLISTALMPPGFKPPIHPFLSARALDPFSEDPIRRILERSKSVEDFIRLLREGGFQVTRTSR